MGEHFGESTFLEESTLGRAHFLRESTLGRALFFRGEQHFFLGESTRRHYGTNIKKVQHEL